MQVAVAPAQENMSARDMFHSAAGLVVPGKTPPKPAAKAKPAQKPVEQAKKLPPAPPRETQPAQRTEEYIPVSHPSGGPLGLRYSLVKDLGGARTAEVDADSVFRSGDRIRLKIQASDTAYLYIIQRGSSGNWGRLFPSAEIAGGNNLIEKGRHYEIPAGHWFAFDQQPGKEALFIVLCRQPEADLEKMIYTIREGQESRSQKLLMAETLRPIDDSLVGKIRAQVYARDLVFEKVDEKTPGPQKEKAMYVVNRTGDADSRVIADLTLNHQ